MARDNFIKHESRFTRSADGTEIYTDAIGDRSPASPTIILIHGSSMVKGVFDPVFEDPKWTSGAFLVRYDTRGHGRSGKPLTDEAWESRRISEDFEAVCKEFDIKEAFILGWSVGSSHFVDIATYNTSVTISGLINVVGAVYLEPSITACTINHQNFEVIKRLASPTSVDVFQEAVFDFLHTCSGMLSPNLFRVLLEGILLQPRSVAMRINSRSQDPGKLLQEAREGRLPLLLVTCGKDKLLNAEGLKGVVHDLGWKKCTNSHLEEADHIPWVSCPEAFRETVLGWVKVQ